MKQKELIVIALILIVTGSIISLPFILSLKSLQTTHSGYLSGTQGLEAQFNSLYWLNQWWSYSEYRLTTTSSMSFGYTMDFDPDGSTYGMPDLCGSQQPMTLQTDVEPKKYVWSYKVGSQTLQNGTILDEYKQFEMYRYKMDWAINVWLSGTELETQYVPWDLYTTFGEPKFPTYAGAELWLKVEPRAFVYFLENPDHVYFAPCYTGLSEDVKWSGINNDGTTTTNDWEVARQEDLIPKVQGEVLGIYYERGGAAELKEDTLLKYQGATLDPEIFRQEYWMRINLIDFKPLSWYIWGAHNWKYPSAYMHFLVYMFVVGEWTVYFKTGEIPQLTPHTPMSYQINPFAWVGDILSNPLFWLGMFGIGTLILIVLLLVFAGPAVMVFFQWAFGRKQQK